MPRSSAITYFDCEGRDDNLIGVLRVLKRALRRRPELRKYKIIFFTAVGQGPALAYSQLSEYDPQIIAVTFPLTFYVRRDDEKFYPRIPEKYERFFKERELRVITGRLPFDPIDGAIAHNEQMKLISDVLSLFCGSFSQCVQAVLQACDAGAVEPGEDVIGVTGDCVAIMTAAYTKTFLARDGGLVIREILCKPRTLSIARTKRGVAPVPVQQTFEVIEGTPPSQADVLQGREKLPEKKA